MGGNYAVAEHFAIYVCLFLFFLYFLWDVGAVWILFSLDIVWWCLQFVAFFA